MRLDVPPYLLDPEPARMCSNCGEGDLDFEMCPNTHNSGDPWCVYCCACHWDEGPTCPACERGDHGDCDGSAWGHSPTSSPSARCECSVSPSVAWHCSRRKA